MSYENSSSKASILRRISQLKMSILLLLKPLFGGLRGKTKQAGDL